MMDDEYELLWGDIRDEEIDIEDLMIMKNPLYKYRRGILNVCDLPQQLWCEHKLFLSLATPLKFIQKPSYVSTGASLHLLRELEVQSVEKVKVTSAEDTFGIKVLNLLTSITDLLHSCSVRREVPIFGIPFNCGVFMTGVIDELRCDADTFQIDLVELKTRKNKALPHSAQKEMHNLQIMIYKSLLDNLIQNKLSKEQMINFLKLDLKKLFGKGLMNQLKHHNYHFNNLDGLLDELFTIMQGFPNVTNLIIDYCFQEDGQTFEMEKIVYDEDWLKEKLNYLFQFWKGERFARGVDINEAWKCHCCEFSDICTWRREKSKDNIRGPFNIS